MNKYLMTIIPVMLLSGCSTFSSAPDPLPVVAIDCPMPEYDDPSGKILNSLY